MGDTPGGYVSSKHASMRSARSLTLAGLLLALGVLLHTGGILGPLRENFRAIARGGGGRDNVTCVVYERPPRTGSSTIAESLRTCLHHKGYDWGQGPWMEYDSVIPFIVAREGSRKALVTRHFVLPYAQLRALTAHCDGMLWISSTRRMKERLVSKAKFDVRGKHGSSVLGREDEKRVKQNLVGKESEEAEVLYEAYPYVGDGMMVRVMPDYIVRSEYLEKDLGKLLKALQCGNQVKTRNVHALNGSQTDDVYIKSVSLKLGDRRHKLMSYLATEVNQRGLDMAREFSSR